MLKYKALTVEYLPITDTKPARCKICDNIERQTVIIAINKNDNYILDTAKRHLEGKTQICGYAETKNGFILFVDLEFNLKG